MYKKGTKYKIIKFSPCSKIEGRTCVYIGTTKEEDDEYFDDYYKFKVDDPYEVDGEKHEYIYKTMGGGFAHVVLEEYYKSHKKIQKKYNI